MHCFQTNVYPSLTARVYDDIVAMTAMSSCVLANCPVTPAASLLLGFGGLGSLYEVRQAFFLEGTIKGDSVLLAIGSSV